MGENKTGVRLGRVVLVYVALTIAVITLAPFRFSLASINPVTLGLRSLDAAMNVIMFVPIGFIYQLSRRRGITSGLGKAFALGAVLSLLCECAQMFEPGRIPAVADVVTNTIGSGVGAALAIVAFGRTDPATAVRAFAVELPLMGVVYMLVPVAWLLAVGSGSDARGWLVLFLAVCAAWIIAEVFTSFERAPLRRAMLATCAWCIVALAPTAIESLARGGVAAGIAIMICAARALVPRREQQDTDRRFEAKTLRVVLPLLCIYIIGSSLTPMLAPRADWLGFVQLFHDAGTPSNTEIFRALEHIAGFTLIGYAIAEYGGRVRERFSAVVGPVLGFAIVASMLLEIARGWHRAYGASASMFALTLLGAALGGWLYVLQLAHVRVLVGRAGR